jgi:hypothetical protein
MYLHVKMHLGAIAKLLKTTFNIVMSVSPHGTIWLLLDGFLLNLILEYFQWFVEKNQVSL